MIKQDIEQDIELAKMMAADIDRLYKKYAKAALQASEERLEKIRNQSYHGCMTAEELQDLYGYGTITLAEYDEGLDYIAQREERKKQLSLVELHRRNLKDLRDRWKGTVGELRGELNDMNGVVKDKRTYIEKLEAAERAERYATLL
ncbi:hypothetical protein SDC9_196859 [bioreactor metagenome]|uniref:Flagellar FliJ protein n=1 Tax=bioreactor metagenome TaxID=1076179 RepID=A0A645ILQ4_9ZZZZ|nr:hypothetical protein [Lachnospiraceae bacterium]